MQEHKYSVVMSKIINRLRYHSRQFWQSIELTTGFAVKKVKRANIRKRFNEGRLWYQEQFFEFNISPDDKVLDIGSGPFPFKYATVLCEKYMDDTTHRRGKIVTAGLPLYTADICERLPFEDKEFDFVYCAHVLEHVDDPFKACKEIMRVGKRGFIETPNFMKDALFCQAEGMSHRWHTIAQKNTLFFFEYSKRQAEGVRSTAWKDEIWSDYHHPLQDVFLNNQDLFNTMFYWEDSFEIVVIEQN